MKLSVPLFLLSTSSFTSTAAGLTIKGPSKTEIDDLNSQNNSSSGPLKFAVPHEVSIDACNAGEMTGDMWALNIESPGAKSLNFGFRKLKIPAGGKMRIKSAADDSETAEIEVRDNKNASEEYWTRIIPSDSVNISIELPGGVRPSCGKIELTSINVGFTGFGTSRSGNCNVDVVCPERAGWEKEIKSVAGYSFGGSIFCTGAMINNFREDRTPYFLTANHCGVRANDAGSVVTYWNFETTTCGGPRDGSLGQALTGGATLIVSNGQTDVTLLRLNQEPPSEYRVAYAGWEATPEEYTLPGVAIHQPSGDEKAISFETDPMASASYLGNNINPSGTHVRVRDWDLGTTEPGSSGSPLFNGNNRIIGQLHGGSAACGNNKADWFGRFSLSWSSNALFRLALDPDDVLDGGVGGIDTYDPFSFPTISPAPTERPTPCNGGPFELDLLTDDYGEETTWSLTNEDTNSVVASGGTYPNAALIEVDQCINEGCYKFVINDSYGDGICCGEFGNGYYVVTVNGDIIRQGGEFGSTEETEFCTGSAECEDSGASVFYNGRSVSCAQVESAGKCSVAVAASHCPNTCGACDVYGCEDSLAPWITDGVSNSCATLAGLDADGIAESCETSSVASTCRETCDFCAN